MSNTSDPLRTAVATGDTPTIDRVVAATRATAAAVRAMAFWAAIGLPLVYLPALAMGHSGVFLALFAAQIACVIAGHDYKKDEAPYTP